MRKSAVVTREDTVEIEGEPAYPIYHIGVKWVDKENGENMGGGNRMYREHPHESKLLEHAGELMEQYRNDREITKIRNLEIDYLFHETWCLSWFQHWTFDVGQTDRQALSSFQQYVNRHRWYQDLPLEETERVEEELGHKKICLMGAEDRWRWKGSEDGSNEHAKETDPPCRCEYCQEQGVLRIAH